MSTESPTNTTPATAPAIALPTDATITKDIAWLRTHVILTLASLAVVVALVLGGIYGIETLKEKHDERLQAQADAKLALVTTQLNALQNKMTSDEQVAAQRDAALLQTISSLAAQITARDKQTQKQVQKDATLDASSAANRLIGQTGASPNEITVQGDNVTLDLPVTRRVVADLDKLPTVQADLADTQSQLTAQTQLTADAKQNFSNAQAVINEYPAKLAAQINADNTACNVRVDKTRKRGFWATVIGTVAGFAFGAARF